MRFASVALCLSLAVTGCQEPEPGTQPEPTPSPLQYPSGAQAFVDVDVAWMGDDQLLEDRRIVVHDGRILDVLGPADGMLPDDVEVLATGGYILPGLTDLHVHAWFETDLTLFLANGVTTVRNLFGDPVQLGWRAEVADGERLGPTIITAGPIVDGDPPIWPTSDVVVDKTGAVETVEAQVDAGYDLIKVYNRLTEPAWRAVLEEASAQGVQAVGHVPSSVSYSDVAGSSQATIEHLDGLLEEVAGISWWDPLTEAEVVTALEGVSASDLTDIAALLVTEETWNVPTLVVLNAIRMSEADLAERMAAPELAYIHPQIRAGWLATVAATADQMDAWDRLMDAWMSTVDTFEEAGAGIGLGSDCGNAFVIPGFSVHEELALLVEAGLTPYEALRAGTSDAAKAVDQAGEFGTVEAGRRADLLWLESNPLEDVAHVQRPAGVMAAGTWLLRDELDDELAKVATEYAR